MSYARTALLLAALTALFLAIGFLIGGEMGMLIALGLAGAMNLWAYWNSDKMVLSMYGAEEVDRGSAPGLYGMVESLAERAELPMPKVYVIHNDQPNAFATGRNPENAAVAATTGLLNRLSSEEVAGVLAHELAHVRNRDTLIMTITAALAGAIGMLAQFGFFFGGGGRDENGNQSSLGPIVGLLVMILAPLGAMLVQMAISRSREYEADRIGAEICGQPLWLANALESIAHGAEETYNAEAEQNPATAHLFIINPLHGSGLSSLFSTHPATEERVARLRAMAGVGAGARPAAKRPWG